jgi:hypothetical protein
MTSTGRRRGDSTPALRWTIVNRHGRVPMTVTALGTPGGCRSVRDRDRAHAGPRGGGYRAAALRAAPNRLIGTPYGDIQDEFAEFAETES